MKKIASLTDLPDAVDTEVIDWRHALSNIAQGLGNMFAPNCEVVLHDLTKPEQAILAIYNPLSGRKIGDPATNMGWTRVYDADFPEIIQNYANRFPDGRHCKSTSIGIRDVSGKYIAALCLNLDLSYLTQVHHMLGQWINITSTEKITESLKPLSLEDITHDIEQFAQIKNLAANHLNVHHRLELLKILEQKGFLSLKNAHQHIANILNISRSSVYHYLKKTILINTKSDK